MGILIFIINRYAIYILYSRLRVLASIRLLFTSVSFSLGKRHANDVRGGFGNFSPCPGPSSTKNEATPFILSSSLSISWFTWAHLWATGHNHRTFAENTSSYCCGDWLTDTFEAKPYITTHPVSQSTLSEFLAVDGQTFITITPADQQSSHTHGATAAATKRTNNVGDWREKGQQKLTWPHHMTRWLTHMARRSMIYVA